MKVRTNPLNCGTTLVMCRVSKLRGNWSYIKPIMVSCPIKTSEHVVQEATAWTWHNIYSEFSRQHLCKAHSNCNPARLSRRGLGYLRLTAFMQEIFLLVPTYSFPPATSKVCPVWFVLSYFDKTLYVFFTFPNTTSYCVRSRVMYCTYITCM